MTLVGHTEELAEDIERKPRQVASWGHLIGFLLIMAGVAAMGFWGQHAASVASQKAAEQAAAGSVAAGSASSRQLASHSAAIGIYGVALLMDWALFYYCWVGARKYGTTLENLSGGRWPSWRKLLKDVGVALIFWPLWEGAAYGTHWLLDLNGPGNAKTVDSLLPTSLLEIGMWILLCITAGFCEELAFRGYLQRQLHALGGNATIAVLGQALVFGIAHSYQGIKNVIVIVVLGILYGALAMVRKNLRANMIAHGWSDFWEGWLKQVIWR